MDVCIEMSGLGRRFGSSWVLSGLNLTVRKGESIALFGSNGSGKSTLLRVLATLLAPSTGYLKILGLDASQKREIRKKVCLLAHEKQLYESLTVMENMQLAAGLRGLGSREEGILLSLLERLKIADRRDQRVGELSEGLKKRLVFARLLLGDVTGDLELMLLDEPHPALDQEGREILNSLMMEWKQQGKTILIASHDQEETLRFVDRAFVLENGRWMNDGKPS